MQRVLDIILCSLALFTLTPILLLIIIILRLSGEGEVLYRQVRVGKNYCDFFVLKFATMQKNSPNIGTGTITLKNDPRVLPFGRILRKTKLNEIPQLFNVLKGDMSLIGPRPQTHRCFNSFDRHSQQIISTVRPGLSGIGSIIFRDEELMLDLAHNSIHFYDNIVAPYKGMLEQWYVRKKGTKIYCYLIFLTIVCVMNPSSSLAWKLFSDLPKPPNELINYFDI
ncbi:sugar transferase [Planktomarina temperata]|nr:sugar transferase [Planktomarina temperata]